MNNPKHDPNQSLLSEMKRLLTPERVIEISQQVADETSDPSQRARMLAIIQTYRTRPSQDALQIVSRALRAAEG